jgi:hypothetical protein
MKCLALVCGIDANRQPVKRAHCKGCVRFIKNGLEEKSPTFRFFNRLIAPGFSRLRNGMLTDEDMDAARRAAMEANSFEQHDTEN